MQFTHANLHLKTQTVELKNDLRRDKFSKLLTFYFNDLRSDKFSKCVTFINVLRSSNLRNVVYPNEVIISLDQAQKSVVDGG